MAHFSELKDELEDCKVKVPCRLRSLFDQVALYFLKKVCVNKDVIRAFPPKLCNGVEADLFTLFWVVRKIGDYKLVSKNELWESVAKECGLDVTHVGSLKLIYIKYLKELDQWLSHGGFKDTKFENGEVGVVEKLDLLFRELRECKYNLSSVGFETDKKGKCVVIESREDGGTKSALGFIEKLDLDMSKSEKGFSRINNVGVKDEEFDGLELNMDISEMGFSKNSNVDKKDEVFGGLDGFSRISNVHNNDKESGGLDLNFAKSEVGFSRISNVDKKGEEFGRLNKKRSELSRDTVVKKVDISGNKDDDDKNVVLCPVNVYSFQSNNNEHNDTSDNDNSTMIFTKSIVKNVGRSPKRKKEESLSVSKLLDWVANAARNQNDSAIGVIPKSSKWKKYKGNEVWKQVLSLKETLFAKRDVDSGNKVYGSQKKRHTMHPSMYEDDKNPIHLASKRIRCSQRASSLKSCSCPGCTSCSSSKNKRHKPDVKKIPQILETVETQDNVCEDVETESVAVRAEVPKWTGVVSDSDPKWLGTQMWSPLEDSNGKHETDFLVIGKGRECSCTCSFPGSADCVRLHIAENRTKVKHTLGPLFYKWKFDHMGEEASVSLWSQEEKTEFKSLVIKARQELTDKSKSRHEIMCNFWSGASESIPFKTKDMVVSYYFNVFVLRRRSYQNRIMPENIDSDDDEQEVGYEKIHALSVKNAEFMNLES